MIDDFDLDEIKALLGDYGEEASNPQAHNIQTNEKPDSTASRGRESLNYEGTASEFGEQRRQSVPKAETPDVYESNHKVSPRQAHVRYATTELKEPVKENSFYESETQKIVDQEEFRKKRAEARKAKAKEMQRRKNGVKHSVPFFIALCCIAVLAWMIPIRPTVSESEKRILATFPEFSADALFSGDYFSDIDTWFSDTFTFRENWISAADSFKELYGIRTVVLYGETEIFSEDNDITSISSETSGQSGEDDTGDIADVSSIDSIQSYDSENDTDGSEITDVSQTEDVEEDVWGGVVINDEDFVSDGKILIIGNESFKQTSYSENGCNQFAELANKAGELLEGKANLYVLLVPENGTTKLTQEDRLYYGFELEEEGFDLIFSQLKGNALAVNVLDRLIEHNDEYTVFRTDHHWTALGAYYAYEEWCEVAGVDAVPLSEYNELEFPGFLGTYYYCTGENKHLGETPDTVYAYEPPGNIEMYMNTGGGDGLGGKQNSLLLDMSKSQAGRKYMTFLGTDEARITFINNDITDGSAVMVIKNSFGNPFVYYLTQHYQYVYVVDYRYYKVRGLTSFVDHFDVDDVIICAGLGFVAESGGLSILNTFLK